MIHLSSFCFWTQRHSVFSVAVFWRLCTSDGRFQIDIREQKYSMILTALDQLARVKLRPRLIWVTTLPSTWMFGMMLGAYSFEYEQGCLLYEYGFQQKSFRFHRSQRSNFFFVDSFFEEKGFKSRILPSLDPLSSCAMLAACCVWIYIHKSRILFLQYIFFTEVDRVLAEKVKRCTPWMVSHKHYPTVFFTFSANRVRGKNWEVFQLSKKGFFTCKE